MSSYPIEAGKLLETANRMVPAHPGRGRPAYTDHRRALSTAYYAVFHAITDRVARAAFSEADDAFLRRVQRERSTAIAHRGALAARWRRAPCRCRHAEDR